MVTHFPPLGGALPTPALATTQPARNAAGAVHDALIPTSLPIAVASLFFLVYLVLSLIFFIWSFSLTQLPPSVGSTVHPMGVNVHSTDFRSHAVLSDGSSESVLSSSVRPMFSLYV